MVELETSVREPRERGQMRTGPAGTRLGAVATCNTGVDRGRGRFTRLNYTPIENG